MKALMEARPLSVGYGTAMAVRDLDLFVNPGEVVALVGPNGAGKSTVLKTLAGELRPAAGEVWWDGQPAEGRMHQRARQGLGYVTEERSIFTRLTARQNLAIGRRCDPDRAISLFPELKALLSRRGGLLSGGEQQMLTLGRVLSMPIRMLMADELSLGLAPQTVERLLTALRAAADDGLAVLVVEQQVHRILKVADRVYLMRRGEVEFEGSVEEARRRIDDITELYMSSSKSSSDSSTDTNDHHKESK